MNRFEIRDILNQHKEHFRVLPTAVCNDLMGVIQSVNAQEVEVEVTPVVPEKEKQVVVGKRTRKAKKKPKRS